MLIIRDEHFIKVNDKLYIQGSSSNELYLNNIIQMGEIEVLGWITVCSSNEGLTPLVDDKRLKVLELSNTLSFRDKVKSIKQIVKGTKCLSIKFCFVDSFIACHYANRYSKPYVIESGTSAFESSWYHGGSIKYKLIAFPYELITKYYHAKSKYIIYVSRRFLQKQYPSKAIQIGCPDVVLSDVGVDTLNKRLNRIDSMQKITLGLIGTTTAKFRGHDRLILIASNLIKNGVDVDVRFLGNDEGKYELSKLAKNEGILNNVFFDGYRNKQGVYDWIDEIDILVMPTIQETLGRAVIEAMSRACPVIGSSETALPEQLGSDCIVSAFDIEANTKIIENMIKDREYMKLCALENYYRAKKYSSSVTNLIKKNFYKKFYKDNRIELA